MAENENWQELEKKAGSKASGALRASLRSVIAEKFKKRTGQMERTNVRAAYVGGQLDRLVITSPHYSFMQHYGYHEPNEKVGTFARGGAFVRAYARTSGGFAAVRLVQAYARRGGTVKGYSRDISNKETGHVTEAIEKSNVLETLADDLANSRAVNVISKIVV